MMGASLVDLMVMPKRWYVTLSLGVSSHLAARSAELFSREQERVVHCGVGVGSIHLVLVHRFSCSSQ